MKTESFFSFYFENVLIACKLIEVKLMNGG
jgi:hypothetical protein